jgi:hypothetical protein
MRPGFIIVMGVAVIALVLTTILLLPPPNIRKVAERLMPPDTLIISELNYGDVIGVSGTTTQSLVNVAKFYRQRLQLGQSAIVGSGISSWSEARVLFGGFRSGVMMPYSIEGFAILIRDKSDLRAIVASKATNESATTVEVFCERKNKLKNFSGLVGKASRFSPPQGIASSSASSLLIDSAIFMSVSSFTNIVGHYLTNTPGTSPLAPTNRTVLPAGRSMVSIPERSGAQSATFLVRGSTDETVLIHCFRSGASTQTHVLVGCAAR